MNVKSNDVNPLSGETSEEVSHLPRRRRKLFAGIRSCRNEGQNVQVLARKVEGLSARPEMRFQDEPAPPRGNSKLGHQKSAG